MPKATILIVEDEAIVAEDLSQKLGRLGYEVGGVTARGDEAIVLARDRRPDLVLMDIRLQGRMDGVEAAEHIGRECARPVIFLTAHSDHATVQRAKLTEPFGYILKPFEELDLQTHIEMALYKHQAEQKLRQQREWLRVTLSSIGDAVLATDTAGRITFINPVAADLTGWQEEQALGQPLENVFQIINERTRKQAENLVARVLRENRVIGLANHTALVAKDGREIPIEDSAAPILDAAGKVEGVVLVFHDTTAKRRAQEALRESEARYRSLFEHMLDGFAHCRMLYEEDAPRDFIYLNVNDAFGRLTGLKNVVGKKVSKVIPGIHQSNPDLLQTYARVVQTGQPERFETYLESLGIWFSIAVYRPEKDHFVAIFDDITVRKRAEEASRERKESLERLVQERTAKLQELVGELEHFSYSITHDMRAPLRGMRGFAEMMTEACSTCQEEAPKDFLRRIAKSADRMDLLITDALSYSKAVRQELALEPVDAGALLRGMLDSYPELQPSKAQIEIQGEIPLVMANEAGLTQCFSNLLGNAVKFVKPGEVPRVRIRAEQRDGWVRLWFEDHGIGIPKAMLARVFDMFSRGHQTYDGTGIGLALVRKVMNRMEGKVGVESEEGQGSRFWLELRPGDMRAEPREG
jgi:PAS domain S-box-containing protein